MDILRFGEETTDRWNRIEDFFRFGESSRKIDASNFLVQIFSDDGRTRAQIIDARNNADGNLADRGTQFLDRLAFFQREGLSRSLLGSQAAGVNAGIEPKNEERVGAVIRHDVVYVFVHAQENRDDGEQRGDADDDAENREKRAHFVFAQRRDRHAGVFIELIPQRGSRSGSISISRPTMGSRRAAFCAGYTPKNTPTAAEMISARTTAVSGIDIGTDVVALTRSVSA